MPKKKELTPKIKCPDCDAEYPTNKGLSSHRRSAHGYVSMGRSAQYERKKLGKGNGPDIKLKCDQCGFVAKTSSALTWHRIKQHTTQRDLKCDQCDFVARFPGGLAWHKRRIHSLEPAPPPPPQSELKCDLCDFVARWKGGLTHHKRAAHPDAHPAPNEVKAHRVVVRRSAKRREFDNPAKAIVVHTAAPTPSNGHHPSQEAHAATDGIPEATLALGLGRFQELSRQLAFEHDLPPRLYASRLAGLIYAATVR